MFKVKSLFSIFGYSVISGIILRISDYICVLSLAGSQNEWSFLGENMTFLIHLALSVILFFAVGFRLKKYAKKEIFFSALLTAFYYTAVLFAEYITQKNGTYRMTAFLWAFLPLELYSSVTNILVNLTSAEKITFWYAVPSVVCPFIFCLFGKGK